MKIFKQKAGVISEDDCWVCVHKEYLYIRPTLIGLIIEMIFYWNHDRNLVG